MFKGIIVGILLGFVFVFLGAYLYFSGGHAPVATDSPEMPFEHKLAHMALNAYIDKQPHPNSPVPGDEANYLAGAKVYKENCAVCHGLPGEPKTAIAEGMFPRPPQLLKGKGVTDDEVWETYIKVVGGIRMTGMPGFKSRLSDTQMWQVSVLMHDADKLPASVKAELSPTPAATPAAATAPAKAEEPAHTHAH